MVTAINETWHAHGVTIMATDPKKDEFSGSEITDEQLENVAGGDKTVDPTDKIFPSKPIDSRAGEKTAQQAP